MAKYGIWQEKDLALNALAATVDREALLDATIETLDTHNAEVNTLLGLFSDPVTEPQAAVKSGNGVARLQPLDENGRPKPIKGNANYYVGFPLFKAGTAEGVNFWTGEQMTVQDYADSLDLQLQADVNWVRDQMMFPLFYNGGGYAFVNPQLNNSVTVYGLANGDATVYNKRTGGAIDDHYSAQADAIDASHNPFPAIYTELTEHPENAGRVVSFVADNQVASVSLLPGFVDAVPDLIQVVPAAGSITTDPLVAPAIGIPLSRTMNHIGAIGNTQIVSWSNIPDSYIVSLAVDAQVKPLGRRQYPQASLQGLINIGEPMSRFPYQQTNYLRAMGFGGRNRVGAHIHRVGNGSYAAPTGFSFPLG